MSHNISMNINTYISPRHSWNLGSLDQTFLILKYIFKIILSCVVIVLPGVPASFLVFIFKIWKVYIFISKSFLYVCQYFVFVLFTISRIIIRYVFKWVIYSLESSKTKIQSAHKNDTLIYNYLLFMMGPIMQHQLWMIFNHDVVTQGFEILFDIFRSIIHNIAVFLI